LAFIQMMYSETANIPHIAAIAIHAKICDFRSGLAAGRPSAGFAGSGRAATGELPAADKGVVEVVAVSSSTSTVNLLSHGVQRGSRELGAAMGAANQHSGRRRQWGFLESRRFAN